MKNFEIMPGPIWSMLAARAEGEKIIADLPTGLGELVVIEGAGHYPHAQTPDELLALTLPFLAKVLPHA